MSLPVKYSVVIPVYNSSDLLNELCAKIDAVFSGKDYELILVDDGSKDGSREVLKKMQKDYKGKMITVLLSKNYGQHVALFCGLKFCSGEYIITMDDDLQHPPEEIPKLIAKQKETGADVVYGIYKAKQHSAIRNSGSFFVRKSSSITKGYSGIGSSFRLIKKEITDKIIASNNNGFLFLDEVFYWFTTFFASVEVEHHSRKSGKSGYSFSKLLNLYFNIVVNYSAIPLKMMIGFGFASSLFCFLLGIRFIYRKLVHQVPLGYTSLIVTVLFSAGIMMMCLGIIGLYLYRLYQSNQNKPRYLINEILK